LKCCFCIFFPLFFQAQNSAKQPKNTPHTLRNNGKRKKRRRRRGDLEKSADRCKNPPIFPKNVFLRVKRDTIGTRATTWIHDFKSPEQRPKTLKMCKSPAGIPDFECREAAAGLKPLAAARPCGTEYFSPLWERGRSGGEGGSGGSMFANSDFWALVLLNLLSDYQNLWGF